MKEYLLAACLLMILWSNRDRLPVEYQFWRQNETQIQVLNRSDQDITGVGLVVWATPHPLGNISKGLAKELRVPRQRDTTEVVIRFKYRQELIERHAGTLNEENNYRMNILVHFAGVVLTEYGLEASAAAESAQ